MADSSSISCLIEKLKTGSVVERCQAAEELGRVGPDAREAVPALLDALNDPGETAELVSIPSYSSEVEWHYSYVRFSAACALFRVSPEHMTRARPVMLETWKKPVRTEAHAGARLEIVGYSHDMWLAAGGLP
jgi:hypothetical protein